MPVEVATVPAVGKSEPVGILEIAERLGVPRGTVAVWHHRGLMPDPPWTVSGAPAWNWYTIERWAKRTGRWPEEE